MVVVFFFFHTAFIQETELAYDLFDIKTLFYSKTSTFL